MIDTRRLNSKPRKSTKPTGNVSVPRSIVFSAFRFDRDVENISINSCSKEVFGILLIIYASEV